MHDPKEFIRDGQIHRAGMLDALREDLDGIVRCYHAAGMTHDDVDRVLQDMLGRSAQRAS